MTKVRLPVRRRSSAGARRCVRERVGLMGIDAGGTTGVAWWKGELLDGIKETLAAGEFGFTQIDCGNGNVALERAGAERLARLYVEQQAEWTLASIPVQHQWLVVEDFVLRQKVGSKQRVGLSSPRIVGLLEGMLVRVVDGEHVARYPPNRSKAFATSPRLKDWGLWARSAPHARDAAKQVALHVAVLLDER